MLDDKYKKAFLEEAFEFVESANQLILYLEKDPTNESTINELFRIMHSLKSEAGLLGFSTIMEISHILEDLFDNFRKKKLPISNETINIILKAIDFINDSLNSISATSEEITETDIIDKLKQAYLSIQGGGKIEKKSSISEQEKKEKEESFLLDDLEISFGKPIDFANIKQQFILSDFETHLIESEKATYLLVEVKVIDNCIMKYPRMYLVYNNLRSSVEVIKTIPDIEEDQDDSHYDTISFIIKVTGDYKNEDFYNLFKVDEIKSVRISEIKQIEHSREDEETEVSISNSKVNSDESLNILKKSSNSTLRIDIEKLDALGRSAGEIITNRAKFEQILEYLRGGESINFIIQKMEEAQGELFRISDELQTIIMQLRMIPVSIVFNKFPRVVRDIAAKLNKDVDFIILGADTEIDKKVIEEIQDPITHIIRNAIDHGIESKNERIAKGKPPRGKITLGAYQEGSNIIIEVSDDGAGLNYDKIASKVKKLYSDVNVDALSQNELIDYLFKPGFSTKDEITTLSGRGVGLDVVKDHITRLRGRIEVTTEKNIGTSIKLILPLTLTILEVLMVKSCDSFYAIPIFNIEQTDRIPFSSIEQLDNYDILQYRNEVYSVMYLSELVGKGKKIKLEEDLVYIVIVRYNRRKVCILIDDLVGEQDIVVQSLDDVFKRIKGISGVAILGDGSIALILDIPEIVNDFVKKNTAILNKIEENSNLARIHDEIVANYKNPEVLTDNKKTFTEVNINFNENERIQKKEDQNSENANDNKDKQDGSSEITELSILDLS